MQPAVRNTFHRLQTFVLTAGAPHSFGLCLHPPRQACVSELLSTPGSADHQHEAKTARLAVRFSLGLQQTSAKHRIDTTFSVVL